MSRCSGLEASHTLEGLSRGWALAAVVAGARHCPSSAILPDGLGPAPGAAPAVRVRPGSAPCRCGAASAQPCVMSGAGHSPDGQRLQGGMAGAGRVPFGSSTNPEAQNGAEGCGFGRKRCRSETQRVNGSRNKHGGEGGSSTNAGAGRGSLAAMGTGCCPRRFLPSGASAGLVALPGQDLQPRPRSQPGARWEPQRGGGGLWVLDEPGPREDGKLVTELGNLLLLQGQAGNGDFPCRRQRDLLHSFFQWEDLTGCLQLLAELTVLPPIPLLSAHL